jgi:hypothetical protein
MNKPDILYNSSFTIRQFNIVNHVKYGEVFPNIKVGSDDVGF